MHDVTYDVSPSGFHCKKHFKLAGSYFKRRIPGNQNILLEYCSSKKLVKESKSISPNSTYKFQLFIQNTKNNILLLSCFLFKQHLFHKNQYIN